MTGCHVKRTDFSACNRNIGITESVGGGLRQIMTFHATFLSSKDGEESETPPLRKKL